MFAFVGISPDGVLLSSYVEDRQKKKTLFKEHGLNKDRVRGGARDTEVYDTAPHAMARTDTDIPLAALVRNVLDQEIILVRVFPPLRSYNQGNPSQVIFTGAQPKAGTGHKMQTVSVVFSTLHC